ncbi:MAG: DNA cytosine methyltransferase [Phenylobacterium sp.]|nr:DNA cytosine methyltransferase [Phenylobacterium sp.]
MGGRRAHRSGDPRRVGSRAFQEGGVIYGSVCSGIEAASCAWHPLGWEPAFFSEIDAFPRAVLQHRFAEVPLHGDFTTIKAGDYRPIDLLVGGTPCQSFSIAGLRKGLDDDRGNLALEYLRLADRLRPQWLVWENVPGVLSSSGGRDFGAFLGGLVELGYGFAYRVLDAQFFGVAQRRRRVFVVGYLGDWRPAAAVLFERHSLQGHPAPRRGAGPGTASAAAGGAGDGGGAVQPFEVANCLTARMHKGINTTVDEGQTPVVVNALTANGVGTCGAGDNQAQAGHLLPTAYSIMPMNSGTDYKARETDIAQPVMTTPVGGNQGGDYVVQPMAFDAVQITSAANGTRVSPELPASTLAKGSRLHVAYGFDWQSGGDCRGLDLKPTVQLQAHQSPASLSAMRVRRLTPTECERLQGFPDGWTQVPYRNKPASDGPRYKAIGNSMAVPVMAWIGRRIAQVNTIISLKEAA